MHPDRVPSAGLRPRCIPARAGQPWTGTDGRTEGVLPHKKRIGASPNYRTHKHRLLGRQEGRCAGCQVAFPFRNFTIDHRVPRSAGGTGYIDNLQLLCGACNSVKGQRDHSSLIDALAQQGILPAQSFSARPRPASLTGGGRRRRQAEFEPLNRAHIVPDKTAYHAVRAPPRAR